jgi:hypothetical protein
VAYQKSGMSPGARPGSDRAGFAETLAAAGFVAGAVEGYASALGCSTESST